VRSFFFPGTLILKEEKFCRLGEEVETVEDVNAQVEAETEHDARRRISRL
jgi:hypothetical protein